MIKTLETHSSQACRNGGGGEEGERSVNKEMMKEMQNARRCRETMSDSVSGGDSKEETKSEWG